MAALANVYLQQGHLEEAEQLFAQIIDTKHRVLGNKHPDTLDSTSALAKVYLRQGRLEEAEQLFAQVSDTYVRVLGLQHPHTLTSMNSLALIYDQQGRSSDAKKLFSRVREQREKDVYQKIVGEQDARTQHTASEIVKILEELDTDLSNDSEKGPQPGEAGVH
jgi:tetratricopeptide (TPR) repeat protein